MIKNIQFFHLNNQSYCKITDYHIISKHNKNSFNKSKIHHTESLLLKKRLTDEHDKNTECSVTLNKWHRRNTIQYWWLVVAANQLTMRCKRLDVEIRDHYRWGIQVSRQNIIRCESSPQLTTNMSYKFYIKINSFSYSTVIYS